MSELGWFTCAICGEDYEKDRSDEAARAEAEAYFGHPVDLATCSFVCEDCFEKFERWWGDQRVGETRNE